MSTHDYVIANASGSSVRSDLNNALAAIVSNNSSSSEPSTKYAYMLWVDTTNNLIKLRNSANNAWITLFTAAGGLDVDAVSNFNEDVTFTGANYSAAWNKSHDAFEFSDNAKCTFGASVTPDLSIYHDGTYSRMQDSSTNFVFDANRFTINKPGSPVENIFDANSNGAVTLYYDDNAKFETNSEGIQIHGKTYAEGDVDMPDNAKLLIGNSDDLQLLFDTAPRCNTARDGYTLNFFNDGGTSGKYGINIQCGADDASGTNYAVGFSDGDGTTQGYITFSGGTVTYGAFTAHHPCVVPDADNPSDDSMAYPYGTLLETISIEYTQKDGANTERGIRYKVQKTQSANSRKVLGAYGSSMNGGPDSQTNEHQALVLGDGHILVNNAGGNIEVGDGICSSATAGIGQKATANPSMIIGIAQEAITFTGSETKLVAVQYGLQQFIPWS